MRQSGLQVLFLFLTMATAPPLAHAQVQNKQQQKCAKALSKASAKVSKLQGKLSQLCVRMAGRHKLPARQWAQDCLAADEKGKVAGARIAAQEAQASSCTLPPDFGYKDADAVVTAVIAQQVELVAEIFGASLQDAVAFGKGEARCQGAVVKGAVKLVAAKLKEFHACKNSGLNDGSIASASMLEACFDAIIADTNGKIGKAIAKLQADVTKRCEGAVWGDTFPGTCAGATGSLAFTTCVDRRVNCRICEMLNETDGLSRNCDVFDDGLANGSCTCAPRDRDCAGVCYGQATVDFCGRCDGDNSTCDVITISSDCAPNGGPPGYPHVCSVDEAIDLAAGLANPVLVIDPGEYKAGRLITKKLTVRASTTSSSVVDLGPVPNLECALLASLARFTKRDVVLKGRPGFPLLEVDMAVTQDRLTIHGVGLEAGPGQTALSVRSGSVQMTEGHVVGKVAIQGAAASAAFKNVRSGYPGVVDLRRAGTLPLEPLSPYVTYTSMADCDIAAVAVTAGATYVGINTEITGADDVGIGICVDNATAKLCEGSIHNINPITDPPDPSLNWADDKYGRGGYVMGGGLLRTIGTDIHANREAGLLADGAGSEMILRSGTRVRDTKRWVHLEFGVGLIAQSGAGTDMDDTRVSGNEGPGIYLSSGAQATLANTTLDANTAAAIVVYGADLTTDSTQLTNTASDSGPGAGFGLFIDHVAEGPSLVSVSNSVIEENSLAGIYVTGDGGTTSVSNSLFSNHVGDELSSGTVLFGDGVFAFEVCSGLTLSSNIYIGNLGPHVLLHGSNASLTGSSYTTNGTLDFVQQRCGGCVVPLDTAALAADGLSSATHVIEICPTYDNLIAELALPLWPVDPTASQ